MFNKGKVITGAVIFLILATIPLWKKLSSSPLPEPVIQKDAGPHCVESKEYMRKNHMVLLDHWRNEVVRHNNKDYVNSNGEHFKKSLTKTCLKCHSNKEEFCDTCHKTADVKPYCFDCHLTPKIMSGMKESHSMNLKKSIKTYHESFKSSMVFPHSDRMSKSGSYMQGWFDHISEGGLS